MGDTESNAADRATDSGHRFAIDSITDDELTSAFTEDLWLDRVARKVGFGKLSALLPGEVPPSYLYAVVLIVTIDTVLNGRAYLLGEPVVYFQNPYFVFQPMTLLAAVYGSRALRTRYHRVMKEMDIEDRASTPEQLIDIVPNWLPWVFFVFLCGVNYVRVLSLGGPLTVYREQGLSVFVGWMVANPIWASIAAQFLAVYLAIVLLAPWRLWNSDVGIDFLDPEGLGGLRPLGELIKHAYYYLVAGLIAFALLLYTPGISAPELERTAATNVSFTVAWIAAVATVAVGVFILHRFMRQHKRHELRRLKKAKQRQMENPWDIAKYTVSPDKRDIVEEVDSRIEKVSATNEYPATFSIWSQLLLSIIIPKAAQLLIAGL